MRNVWTSADKGDRVQAQQYVQEWLDFRRRAFPADSSRWQFTYDCISGLFDAYLGKTEGIGKKLSRAKEILPHIQHPTLKVYTFMLQNLEGEVMLAKLYEEKNWPGLAIQAYTRFLELWQDADEGLPELVDARMRLAKRDNGAEK